MTAEFDEWVAARGPGLLRLAYVLTGNRADAEDAVQDALARALPRWEHIRTVGDPDAYVRRMVVNAHTSWWRRFRRRETPVAEAFGQSAGTDPVLVLAGRRSLGRRDERLGHRRLALAELAPPGRVRVDDHPPYVGVRVANRTDVVPPGQRPGERVLHGVLRVCAVTGQHVGEAQQPGAAGGYPFVELGGHRRLTVQEGTHAEQTLVTPDLLRSPPTSSRGSRRSRRRAGRSRPARRR